MKSDIGDLVEQQMRIIGTGTFQQDVVVTREIIAREVEKYAQTLSRGTKIVQKIARSYKTKSQRVPLKEIITLYDSHGISPEIIRDVAAAEGAVIELPDNFYSLIADMHSESRKEEVPDRFGGYRERIRGLPPSRKLYYEQPCDMEFDAMVIDSFDGWVVLDQTLFYPEGGGQPSDTGMLISAENMARIDEVVKEDDVVMHHITGGVLKRGERLKGIIDEERRWSLMRHHTATHLLLRAAKDILGAHIHQAGAQKGVESSRLDIRHFKHITPDEQRKIEIAANRMVMADQPVDIRYEDRVSAEQEFGFELYQGGVPPGRDIRIVHVGGEVEACAGTHCRTTGEIGIIKITGIEHIQDGIERIEFSSGMAAIEYMHRLEGIVDQAADVVSVQREYLPSTVSRFFSEWKDQKKEIDRLSQKLVELEILQMHPELVNGVPVMVRQIDLPPRDLVEIAGKVSEQGGAALLGRGGDRAHVVLLSGHPQVNAGEIIGQVCSLLGGKGGGSGTMAQGGGPETSQLELALKVGRERIIAALHD
jgi:alanyl-tRNA synthetase